MQSNLAKLITVLVLLGVAAFAAYRLLMPESSTDTESSPNIVLITVDTLRQDYLGSYGFADPAVSPRIDAMAARGTRFAQAVTATGTTIPSHGTMLTGLHPRQHGAVSNWVGLDDEVVTVPHRLAEAGYQTAAFVSFESMMKIGRLGRGFQHTNTPFNAPSKKVTQAGEITLRQAQEWLRERLTEAPFYIWFHLFEPHGPYDMTAYAEEKMDGYEGILADGADMKTLLNEQKQILASEENLRALRQLYAGEVNLADQLVGSLLDTLEAQDELDNTVVIFTSDHGQGLGENGQMGHGATLWESVLRVPLIVTDFRSPHSSVVDARVGVIDIATTIGDFAGLAGGFDLNGQSLRDAQEKSFDPDRPYYSGVELRTGKSAEESWYDPDAMAVYSGELKLISARGKLRLYETRTESQELTPVPRQEISALAEYLAGLSEDYLSMESRAQASEVSQDDLEQLQGLGYVQ